MKVKDGVKLNHLQFVMREVLIEADKIWKENNSELTVTSTAESVHSAGSLHYYGLAVDFRTRDLDDVSTHTVYKQLLDKLGDRFIVVKEEDHIHVQLNLKAQQQQ